jgi:hypothetical protein
VRGTAVGEHDTCHDDEGCFVFGVACRRLIAAKDRWRSVRGNAGHVGDATHPDPENAQSVEFNNQTCACVNVCCVRTAWRVSLSLFIVLITLKREPSEEAYDQGK